MLRRKKSGGPSPTVWNQGEADDLKTALGAAVDYAKLLVTLATGTVVLSATFLDKFYFGRSLWLLVAAWSLLGLSILCGLGVMGEFVSRMAESDLTIRHTSMEATTLAQWFTGVGGLLAFGVFVALNITAPPRLSIEGDTARVTSKGVLKVAVSCRAGEKPNCSGTVGGVMRAGGATVPVRSKRFAITDAAAAPVRLWIPRELRRQVTAGTQADVMLTVRARARFGNETTVTEHLSVARR